MSNDAHDGLMLSQARIEAMTAAGLWHERTVLDCLEDRLREQPDKVFVTDHNAMTGRSTSLSFRNLNRVSTRLAAGLSAHGISAGDVVAMQLPNWWEMLALHIACMRIGAITNPLMPIFRERELEFMLSFARTKAVVIPRQFRDFEYEPMLQSLRDSLPSLEHVFVVGGNGEAAFEARLLNQPWEDRVDTRALFASARPSANDVIEYCYTSGTSGRPKAVMHTSNTLFCCLGGALALDLDERDVVLMGSPLAHQTGFLFGGLMPLMLGARLVLMDVWNAAEAAKLIHTEGVTMTMGATPFLSDLTYTNALDRYPPDTLDVFICGGAPIPRPLVQAAKQRLGASIVAGWGMSENGLVTSTRRNDAAQKVLETDGLPWPGMRLRVVDEHGTELGPDLDGTLQANGAANFVGYLNRPQAYDTDAEGWFNTGDVARIDADGYVTITGRAKDIIIRGGENIPVAEVESTLFAHAGVDKVAVVAMPDARLGERACAFVTLHGDASWDLAAMRAHLEACGLTRNYWPERLQVLPVMPMTPSGKIQKYILREQAQSLRA
jgi:cyclohexanecarboxylate-CoA ligase